MKTNKIKALEKKVLREVKQTINAIYKKHNKELVSLIAEQIPKGKSMICGNGMAIVTDNKSSLNDKIGRAWGTEPGDNEDLNYIASLQYWQKYRGCFTIPNRIKSKQ